MGVCLLFFFSLNTSNLSQIKKKIHKNVILAFELKNIIIIIIIIIIITLFKFKNNTSQSIKEGPNWINIYIFIIN